MAGGSGRSAWTRAHSMRSSNNCPPKPLNNPVMKIIYKVAKTELRSLFYSPIAWFLMIVFLIQCGLAYTYSLDSNARSQELAGIGLEYMKDLTERIFGGR